MGDKPLFNRQDRRLIERLIGALDQISDALTTLTEPPSDPAYTVDLKYTDEGVSLSVYDDGTLVDETWHTWSEAQAAAEIDESDVTFELPHQRRAITLTTTPIDNQEDT